MIEVYGVRADRDLTEEERLAAIEYLTPERKAKALRFRRLKDQEKGILTGLLEAYVIHRILHITEYTIQTGSEGKPVIIDHPEFHYNISHAGNLILCGVGDRELGIDVEREDRYSKRVVERFFQPEEIADIQAQEKETEEKAVFAKYWVMKESFMKLSGAGFSVPIQSFFCDRRTGEIRTTEAVPKEWMQRLIEMGLKEDHQPRCVFLPVDPGYQAAVCMLMNRDGNTADIPVRIMNSSELLDLQIHPPSKRST